MRLPARRRAKRHGSGPKLVALAGGDLGRESAGSATARLDEAVKDLARAAAANSVQRHHRPWRRFSAFPAVIRKRSGIQRDDRLVGLAAASVQQKRAKPARISLRRAACDLIQRQAAKPRLLRRDLELLELAAGQPHRLREAMNGDLVEPGAMNDKRRARRPAPAASRRWAGAAWDRERRAAEPSGAPD